MLVYDGVEQKDGPSGKEIPLIKDHISREVLFAGLDSHVGETCPLQKTEDNPQLGSVWICLER